VKKKHRNFPPGFHLATKIRGGSAINEWAYVARQVPWDVFSEGLLILQDFSVVFDEKWSIIKA
jgi:hypothetical protein